MHYFGLIIFLFILMGCATKYSFNNGHKLGVDESSKVVMVENDGVNIVKNNHFKVPIKPKIKKIEPQKIKIETQRVTSSLGGSKKIIEMPKISKKKNIIKIKPKPKSELEPKSESVSFKLKYDKKLFNYWTKYLLGKNKKRFQRHIKNALKYELIVKNILKKYNIPEDIFFVGLIESGYLNHARSRANAVGYWQFVKGTAKNYGLRVDRSVDERRSIYKSTEAAAKYFKDLFNIFGSWELALLAYNKGEYGVIRAIRKGNSRDYMYLIKKKLLPRETVYYIPKLMAARNIYTNSKKNNVRKNYKRNSFYSNVNTINFDKSFKLTNLSKVAKISVKNILKLNPDIRTQKIYVSRRRPFKVFLPKASVKKLKSWRTKNNYVTRRNKSIRPKLNNFVYIVQSGDNLTTISKKLYISVKKIKKLNRLKRNRLLIGQKLKISGVKISTYIVKRGDNLSIIARRFGLSVTRLLSYNSLDSKRIYPRQRLNIPTTL